MTGDRSLFELFRESLPGAPSAPELGDPARVEPALRDAIAAARGAWAAVEVAPPVFVAWVARRFPADAASIDALKELHLPDLWLACACAHGDATALALFKDKYLSPNFPLPRDLEPLSAEVEQLAAIRLLVPEGAGPPKIADYAGRGDLSSWVSVVALRIALGLLRKQKPEVAFDDDTALSNLSDEDDAEVAHLKKRYRAEFAEAFEHALGTLEPRDRNVLRQHHVDGLTMEQIARVYRVHRITVVRWIDAARTKLASETKNYLVTRMGIERGEIESVMRLIRSQLDLSLRTYLGGDTRS